MNCSKRNFIWSGGCYRPYDAKIIHGQVFALYDRWFAAKSLEILKADIYYLQNKESIMFLMLSYIYYNKIL